MTTFIPSVVSIIDSNNSFSGSITSGGNFTGVATDVTLYSSVVVSIFTTVLSATNGLQIQFSPNGTDWDFIETFTIPSNSQRRYTTPVAYKFFRIIFTTDFPSTTRIQTILTPVQNLNTRLISDGISLDKTLCQINNSMGMALLEGSVFTPNYLRSDNRGNVSVNINGPSSALNSFGDFRLNLPTPVSQLDFVYGRNPNLSILTLVGSGTSVINAPRLTLRTTATANSTVTLTSKKYLKYKMGQGSLTRFSVLFNTPQTGTIQLAGCGTANNGFFFGTRDLNVVILYRSSVSGSVVDTLINQFSWNGDTMSGVKTLSNPSGVSLNITNGNIYQICTDGDYGNVYFYILSRFTGEFILVHTIRNSNASLNSLVRNPTLPLYFFCSNTTSSLNTDLTVISGSQFCEGEERFLGSNYAFSNTRIGVTAEITSFVLRNNVLFRTIENLGKIKIVNLSVGTNNGNSISTVTLCLGSGTDVGFSNVDVNNSICSTSTTSVFTISRRIYGVNCGQNSSVNINLEKFNIVINRGEFFGIRVSSTASTNISIGLQWVEDL